MTPKEVVGIIKKNVDPEKVPGFDLLTGEIQKL